MIKPTELKTSFHVDHRTNKLTEIYDKLRKNGLRISGNNHPHPDDYDQVPRDIARIHFQYGDLNDPNRLSFKEIRVIGEDDKRGPEATEIDDYTDLEKVTQYTQALLEAHGFIVKVSSPDEDQLEKNQYIEDTRRWNEILAAQSPEQFKRKGPPITPRIISIPHSLGRKT